MRRMPSAALALVLALLAGGAAAQPYPHKTVTLVTHSSPGGGSDVFLRVLAKHLGPKMGVSFAVENVRGGAGAREGGPMRDIPDPGGRPVGQAAAEVTAAWRPCGPGDARPRRSEGGRRCPCRRRTTPDELLAGRRPRHHLHRRRGVARRRWSVLAMDSYRCDGGTTDSPKSVQCD